MANFWMRSHTFLSALHPCFNKRCGDQFFQGDQYCGDQFFQVFRCMARGTWDSHLYPQLTQRSWLTACLISFRKQQYSPCCICQISDEEGKLVRRFCVQAWTILGNAVNFRKNLKTDKYLDATEKKSHVGIRYHSSCQKHYTAVKRPTYFPAVVTKKKNYDRYTSNHLCSCGVNETIERLILSCTLHSLFCVHSLFILC